MQCICLRGQRKALLGELSVFIAGEQRLGKIKHIRASKEILLMLCGLVKTVSH